MRRACWCRSVRSTAKGRNFLDQPSVGRGGGDLGRDSAGGVWHAPTEGYDGAHVFLEHFATVRE
jgi:hypothetical protein